jgi:protein-S-isoprenylcysteine O-methyltransferase Ste14
VHDEPFRTVLVYESVVLLVVMLFFRIRSQLTSERLDRRKEGWFILLTLRPMALVAFVGFISYLVNPASMAWSFVSLPPAIRWAGAGLCGVGIACLVWTLTCLGRNLTDTVVTRQAATLVTHGPYRYVRHPFYGCIALFFLGSSLLAANWFIAVSYLAVIALLARRTDREEALLVARFGDAYRD